MKEDIKIEKIQISKDEMEELDTSHLDKYVVLLDEFLNLNKIPPDQAMTLMANMLIWICETYFNKEIFLAVLQSVKDGWDVDRG